MRSTLALRWKKVKKWGRKARGDRKRRHDAPLGERSLTEERREAGSGPCRETSRQTQQRDRHGRSSQRARGKPDALASSSANGRVLHGKGVSVRSADRPGAVGAPKHRPVVRAAARSMCVDGACDSSLPRESVRVRFFGTVGACEHAGSALGCRMALTRRGLEVLAPYPRPHSRSGQGRQ